MSASRFPGPEGFLTVQPYLHLRNAHEMIPFIEAALGAKATGVHKSPDGIVRHATIEIAGATFEIDEAQGETQPTQSYLHVYVPDTDAVYTQALAVRRDIGALTLTPPPTATAPPLSPTPSATCGSWPPIWAATSHNAGHLGH